MTQTIIASLIAATLGIGSSASAAATDAWPSRAVRFVVPSSPGGGTDRYARLLAQALSESLKQPFVIDNRPGAAGTVGAEIVARAAPDGHTFLVASSASLAITESLYKNLPYNAERDFAPVARGVRAPGVIVSHPSVPAKTLSALAALGKREPGKVAYGTAGAGSPGHLHLRVFEEVSGARFIHVPYKGVGQALQGVLRGEVAFILGDITSVLPYIRSGRLVALAVTDPTPLLPDMLTTSAGGSSSGYVSFSVVAPAATPPLIVQRLSAEVVTAMKAPGLREKLEALGYIPVFDTPNEFAAELARDRRMWADVIRRNKIMPE
jgi:tripartite-type tricarboxylate transporter receptor subunit TctC